ncbi:MAG: hypothetical protein ABSF71_00955 [Terriglobia bacterium]
MEALFKPVVGNPRRLSGHLIRVDGFRIETLTMPRAHTFRTIMLAAALLGILGALLFPAPLAADQLPGEALNTFPADTLQVAFANLATLRSLSIYPQIRQRILNKQLHAFEEFLRPMGIDPEKDIDEVILGWRGEMVGPAGYLGLAAGRFQPALIQQYFDHTGLPVREYNGSNLYAFGSGSDPDDLFFTFFESTLAGFGRLGDLKAMIDARQGSANALNANSDFVNWQGELDGTAPQWGILNGKSTGNLAALWLAPGGQKNVDLSSLGASVRALLYRVQWDTGFSTNLIMECKTPESAAGFATLIGLLQQAAQKPTPAGGAGLPPILQNIATHRDGARLQLDVSGPPDMLDQILPQGGS